ncbi:MAG: hypothetical protein P8Y97_07060 [Candidatus Lokiarchaeota archaeon]
MLKVNILKFEIIPKFILSRRYLLILLRKRISKRRLIPTEAENATN